MLTPSASRQQPRFGSRISDAWTEISVVMRKVYLDHSATTPIDSRVLEALLPYLTEKFGNASSVPMFGEEARSAVDRARRRLASVLGVRTNAVAFTSGGPGANDLAMRGRCRVPTDYGPRGMDC